jgi:hypothetical protein
LVTPGLWARVMRLSALADDQTRVRLAGRAHGYDYT